LTELLVELSSEVEHVMDALTMTKSASDIVVERGICKPMRRSEAARRGWVEGLLGGRVLAPIRGVSWLSERRRSESLGSGFCDLRWEEVAWK